MPLFKFLGGKICPNNRRCSKTDLMQAMLQKYKTTGKGVKHSGDHMDDKRKIGRKVQPGSQLV